MEREIINNEPYKLEGHSYMFFYDKANGLVISTMPYEYQERQADEDWSRGYGEPLYDTITVDGKKYVELESVGLTYENWQNQAERDEYLHEWINNMKAEIKAEELANTINYDESSVEENTMEDESSDLKQLVNELKNNGMEQTAEQVSQLINQVDNMTNMVQGLMNEITRLNESIQNIQDNRLPNRIKKSLNEDVERIEKRYEETKEQVFEIRDDIKVKAGNIMDDYKMRGKAALNRMLEFIEIKSKLTNVRDRMLQGIEDINRTLNKIDVLGRGLREAGNLVTNTIRNVADKETIDYSSEERNFSKTELIKKPWVAQRKLYEVFVQSLNGIIDKIDGLSKTVRVEMNEDQIDERQEQETGNQDQVEVVQENAEFYRSKLQSFDEFLEENYEMTIEQFEHVSTNERRTIEDEFKEMVSAIIGKEPGEVARESEDHATSFDDKASSVSMDESPKEYEVPDAVINMNKSKTDGELAVRNMSEKAQEYYNGTDTVGVREYSVYDEELGQDVKLYAIDWGSNQIEKNLTFEEVQTRLEEMQDEVDAFNREMESDQNISNDISEPYKQLLVDVYGDNGRQMALEDMKSGDPDKMLQRVEETLRTIGSEDSDYVTRDIQKSADFLMERLKDIAESHTSTEQGKSNEEKRMTDALMEHYGDVTSREKVLKSRISLATAITTQHERVYGPVYDKFDITEKITNCIENLTLANEDGTFELEVRENLQRYTTKQHKVDRETDMKYWDDKIQEAVKQQENFKKDIEAAVQKGDYKELNDKTDLFLQKGNELVQLATDKTQKRMENLQQMKWDSMLNADVWIKQPQPQTCELDGTKIYMDYRLNDVTAMKLRTGHKNDIINDGYPNGYYLGTINGYPQLIIHTQDKVIVSQSMTDDYSEGKSLSAISHDLYHEYWNDMNRVEMKDLSMDNQTATELVTALAKVDAAYEVEQADSLKEIEQRSGQSYRELYYEKKDECRLDKALVPKIGVAAIMEDGTYVLQEVKVIDERLADMIKRNTEQVDIRNLSVDMKPGDFLLLKDNIMDEYQTFMVTEDGLTQMADDRSMEVCNRYCTDQMLSSSFDVEMEQQCVKPLIEHGVTLQPGIQTRFEKNAKLYEMKNPVVPEQRKLQQNKVEMTM